MCVCVCVPVQARKPARACVLPEAVAPSSSPACGWVALAVRKFFNLGLVCLSGGCPGVDFNPSLFVTWWYLSFPPH